MIYYYWTGFLLILQKIVMEKYNKNVQFLGHTVPANYLPITCQLHIILVLYHSTYMYTSSSMKTVHLPLKFIMTYLYLNIKSRGV